MLLPNSCVSAFMAYTNLGLKYRVCISDHLANPVRHSRPIHLLLLILFIINQIAVIVAVSQHRLQLSQRQTNLNYAFDSMSCCLCSSCQSAVIGLSNLPYSLPRLCSIYSVQPYLFQNGGLYLTIIDRKSLKTWEEFHRVRLLEKRGYHDYSLLCQQTVQTVP